VGQEVSQATDIILYIRDHGSITTKQAMEDLGCYRLSGRIYDIKKCGIPVEKTMVDVLNRNGETCRVARYTIPNIPECFSA
jgi:hypothetical protein